MFSVESSSQEMQRPKPNQVGGKGIRWNYSKRENLALFMSPIDELSKCGRELFIAGRRWW